MQIALGYDRLGNWSLDYDKLGSRLKQVGPFSIGYDRLGSRVRSIGDMALDYGRLSSHPNVVTLPDTPNRQLPEGHLVALYFTLDHQHREQAKKRAESSRRSF